MRYIFSDRIQFLSSETSGPELFCSSLEQVGEPDFLSKFKRENRERIPFAGVPFVLHLAARRGDSLNWHFAVEVAVLLTESDLKEFDHIELHWISNGMSLTNRESQVC